MKVYLVLGYDLVTGNQNVVDYIAAENEVEACRKFERRNFNCEANDAFIEGTLEEFVEDSPDEFSHIVEDLLNQAGAMV